VDEQPGGVLRVHCEAEAVPVAVAPAAGGAIAVAPAAGGAREGGEWSGAGEVGADEVGVLVASPQYVLTELLTLAVFRPAWAVPSERTPDRRAAYAALYLEAVELVEAGEALFASRASLLPPSPRLGGAQAARCAAAYAASALGLPVRPLGPPEGGATARRLRAELRRAAGLPPEPGVPPPPPVFPGYRPGGARPRPDYGAAEFRQDGGPEDGSAEPG
jgi:hypothetical protein